MVICVVGFGLVFVDKKFYVLCDVMGIVEVILLIVFSIMLKKIVEGIDVFVFDVKFGFGVFM